MADQLQHEYQIEQQKSRAQQSFGQMAGTGAIVTPD